MQCLNLSKKKNIFPTVQLESISLPHKLPDIIVIQRRDYMHRVDGKEWTATYFYALKFFWTLYLLVSLLALIRDYLLSHSKPLCCVTGAAQLISEKVSTDASFGLPECLVTTMLVVHHELELVRESNPRLIPKDK